MNELRIVGKMMKDNPDTHVIDILNLVVQKHSENVLPNAVHCLLNFTKNSCKLSVDLTFVLYKMKISKNKNKHNGPKSSQ